ncbi:MAG TPA: hypothetical protein VFT72_20200 [Opitutaceae bacterium]|nr:hypothetical protein [Opitutaceae bacterium]
MQAAFVVLMLTGGFAPCLPAWPITEIKLQGKYAGFETDDFIATAEQMPGGRKAKLLAQIKHALTISAADETFGEVIAAAWADFKNPKIFDPASDAIAVVTGPLSGLDIDAVRSLLDHARHCGSAKEFITKITTGLFTSATNRKKLEAFKAQLKKANQGAALSEDELWQFLKCFHVLGYDLDLKSGVTLSLLKSHIGQFSTVNIDDLWNAISREVIDSNAHAGTVTRDTLPQSLRDAFKERVRREQLPAPPPAPSAPAPAPAPLANLHAEALKYLVMAGAFNEKSPADIDAIRKLING